jgi:hypothetical protein
VFVVEQVIKMCVEARTAAADDDDDDLFLSRSFLNNPAGDS